MAVILPFVYVGLGSMLGGVSRYGMSLATQNYAALSMPLGTLVSNVAGCLLIGLIAGIGASSQVLSTEMRLLLATGFCGGFTTMSSFVYELGQFVQDKEYFYASSYFVATTGRRRFGVCVGSVSECMDVEVVMKISGQAVLLRVFIGESDKLGHLPLYEVIVKTGA